MRSLPDFNQRGQQTNVEACPLIHKERPTLAFQVEEDPRIPEVHGRIHE